MSVNVLEKRTDLADAAITPRPAAASATATAVAASPAAPAAATPAAAATAPATPSDFFADPRYCGVLLVENVECRQADVRDFLLTEKVFMGR
jgi:hypothetical protein